MHCNLMHKNVPVAKLELDEDTGVITKISEVINSEHLPIGILKKNNIADRAALNDWWVDKSIPASRSGIREALDLSDLTNTRSLLAKCFGLSLSDQYWIKPDNTDVCWQDINFFDHAFSEDIGDVLLGKAGKKKEFDFHSPDNTTDGCLKKRWKITNGKRHLIKGGSKPFTQQPFNEVIATKIMQRLGIQHIPYGEVVCSPFEVIHTEQELNALGELLKRLSVEIRVVMEATGIYHLPILTYL